MEPEKQFYISAKPAARQGRKATDLEANAQDSRVAYFKVLDMKKFISTLIFATVVAFSSGSMAAAVDFIDNGSYTTDTMTGLDWLDVTATAEMSYNMVQAELAAGGSLYGWRLASGMEFNQMVNDYTDQSNPLDYYGLVDQSPDKIDGLVDLLGATINKSNGEYRSTYGMLADLYQNDDVWLALLYDDDS